VWFQTKDLDKTYADIRQHVSELNGYISNESARHTYDGSQRHEVTVRIPTACFDLLLQRISDSSGPFEYKSIQVKDVTAEYVDVEARIKTKKELKSRYEALLKQAAKVEDMLRIESEIGNLQTEIESVEGRMKLLNDQITYSTLKVEFYQQTTTRTAFGFGAKLFDGLKSGWENFLWFVVGLSHLWVFIIAAAVLIYLFRRRKKKLRSKS